MCVVGGREACPVSPSAISSPAPTVLPTVLPPASPALPPPSPPAPWHRPSSVPPSAAPAAQTPRCTTLSTDMPAPGRRNAVTTQSRRDSRWFRSGSTDCSRLASTRMSQRRWELSKGHVEEQKEALQAGAGDRLTRNSGSQGPPSGLGPGRAVGTEHPPQTPTSSLRPRQGSQQGLIRVRPEHVTGGNGRTERGGESSGGGVPSSQGHPAGALPIRQTPRFHHCSFSAQSHSLRISLNRRFHGARQSCLGAVTVLAQHSGSPRAKLSPDTAPSADPPNLHRGDRVQPLFQGSYGLHSCFT